MIFDKGAIKARACNDGATVLDWHDTLTEFVGQRLRGLAADYPESGVSAAAAATGSNNAAD